MIRDRGGGSDDGVSRGQSGRSASSQRSESGQLNITGCWIGENKFRESVFKECQSKNSRYIKKICDVLIYFLEKGKYTFKTNDIVKATGFETTSVTNFMRNYLNCGLWEIIKIEKGKNVYTFGTGRKFLSKYDYSFRYLEMLGELRNHPLSEAEKRLGRIIESCLPEGCITLNHYKTVGYGEDWEPDMKLAEQMGLVMKVVDDYYFLYKEPVPRFDMMDGGEKKKASEMYEMFGDGSFSIEMVTATLAYDPTATVAYLRRFKLMNILDCREEDDGLYRFLVNPRENPECFIDAA